MKCGNLEDTAKLPVPQQLREYYSRQLSWSEPLLVNWACQTLSLSASGTSWRHWIIYVSLASLPAVWNISPALTPSWMLSSFPQTWKKVWPERILLHYQQEISLSLTVQSLYLSSQSMIWLNHGHVRNLKSSCSYFQMSQLGLNIQPSNCRLAFSGMDNPSLETRLFHNESLQQHKLRHGWKSPTSDNKIHS